MQYDLKKLIYISIILYMLFLIWALLFKLNDVGQIKLSYYLLNSMTPKERFLYDIVPFQFSHPIRLQQLFVVLNAFIFAPFGFFLPIKDDKIKILKHLLICFLISLSFEIIQFFTLIGCFATDDLITNTLGYLIGLLLYMTFFIKLSDKMKFKLIYIFNIILLVIVVFGFVMTIINFNVYLDIILRRL